MDERLAQLMAMRRGQHGQEGQFQGGLALPEQLPQGPVDPQMMQRPMQRPMGPPMGMNRPPMGMPPAQGTPAQMPMANTMNPNANSARPSMRPRPQMGQGQDMYQRRSITPF